MNTASSHEFEFEYGEFGVFKFMLTNHTVTVWNIYRYATGILIVLILFRGVVWYGGITSGI